MLNPSITTMGSGSIPSNSRLPRPPRRSSCSPRRRRPARRCAPASSRGRRRGSRRTRSSTRAGRSACPTPTSAAATVTMQHNGVGVPGTDPLRGSQRLQRSELRPVRRAGHLVDAERPRGRRGLAEARRGRPVHRHDQQRGGQRRRAGSVHLHGDGHRPVGLRRRAHRLGRHRPARRIRRGQPELHLHRARRSRTQPATSGAPPRRRPATSSTAPRTGWATSPPTSRRTTRRSRRPRHATGASSFHLRGFGGAASPDAADAHLQRERPRDTANSSLGFDSAYWSILNETALGGRLARRRRRPGSRCSAESPPSSQQDSVVHHKTVSLSQFAGHQIQLRFALDVHRRQLVHLLR